MEVVFGDSVQRSNSLHSRVYNRIRNDILNGVYEPGESLVELKLSEELGVSRTPVREALRQLELEGLVQSVPNKGATVRGVTEQDIQDIYTIRMLIEGLAARWAAEKITPEELEELKEAVDLEEFYTTKSNYGNLLRFDTRFHDIIFKASKSKPLMYTLSTFHRYVQKARRVSMSSPERAAEVLQEHKAILQAIIDRDADRAEKLMTEHVRNASLNLLKHGNKET
ncbi:MAG: GntR family transcriptional regulator [Clostridiaceae bacterium]|mgnify:CR=1 FL=1|jgi:DNA-binding GntR family transcriptional regulator|nr:GntR family transcriptional regulator [Clostridiaceae bacterium]HOA55061.1 GntR family transcriptional regulator [Clostridiales bacterium]HPZ04573.1 GntR family transcriptional regulator [Clostridiales bacterium]HQD31788.1 GntR family transcriptional regulator [Clostridiales bacterium]